MQNVLFVGLLFFSSIIHALPNISRLDPKDITVLGTREMKNCYVIFVKIKGKKYLIKQKKDTHKPFSAVKEALSAYIAKVLKVAHEVDIIDASVDFLGKIIPDWPATLHTFLEGTSAHKYGKLRLKQFWKSFMTFEERGLTREIIRDMAKDRRLAIIVALDTILCNTDRHGNNLIYGNNIIYDQHKPKNEFWAIDMDDTFGKNLPEFNYQKILFIMQTLAKPFTRQELEGLAVYRDTLKKLLREHTPQSLQKKFRYFVQKAGIVVGSRLYTEKVPHTMSYYENMIQQSWDSAQKLVELLDNFVLIRVKPL